MKKLTSISELPNVPCVYAMYGGQGGKMYVAYVGETGRLKGRIREHLVQQDSSVVARPSAAMLNPEKITQICWWEYPKFEDPDVRKLAELAAFKVLEPVLRSRSPKAKQKLQLLEDEDFREEMHSLFSRNPTGQLIISDFQDVLERIVRLEERVATLEKQLKEEGKN